MRRRYRARPALAAFIALLAAAGAIFWSVVASAYHIDVADAADTKGVLDVKRVVVEGIERPRFKIVTFPRWSVRSVRDRGYFVIYLDTFGSRRYDYYALARSDGSRMRASLWRDRQRKPDRFVSVLDARRPDRRSVAVRIPLGKVRFPSERAAYRWYAQTLFTGDRCRRVCFDRAPDRGGVAEPRPAASPSPSPSVTPSPSPSVSPSLSPSISPSPSVLPTAGAGSEDSASTP